MIASPIRFEAALRSALSVSLSREQPPPIGVERQRAIDERGVLALADRPVADDVRLLAKPLEADAHDAVPAEAIAAASLGPADDEGRIQAGQQPAGARPVGPAEEGAIDGFEGLARRQVVRLGEA